MLSRCSRIDTFRVFLIVISRFLVNIKLKAPTEAATGDWYCPTSFFQMLAAVFVVLTGSFLLCAESTSRKPSWPSVCLPLWYLVQDHVLTFGESAQHGCSGSKWRHYVSFFPFTFTRSVPSLGQRGTAGDAYFHTCVLRREPRSAVEHYVKTYRGVRGSG
ncbi:hypothetical protein JTE90_029405 [Oedothorax gibbosus]|uniref:Uncharacterized protein n=1 Tax=Oedothorax gibbosus TaxID=931172 RepID=A0AAV6UAA0_9ARAC|nr:hypothetical protein JTE90_029405 [Oedothorax gibbosus]